MTTCGSASGGVDDAEPDTAALFAHMHDPAAGPDQRRRARARIIELNLSFARRLAHRFRHRGQDDDDLEQVAAFALVKAVDGFDPERGSPFFGYLIPTVVGELKRHFRDKGWTLHVGRRLQERHLELVPVRASLMQELRRSPTAGELASALQVSVEEVLETLAAGNAYDVDSLNARSSADDDAAERQDFVGDDDFDLVSTCDRLVLHDLLRRLPEREQYVLIRYFFGEATQEQIASALGMSQMNVSRLLRRALQTLRRQLDGDAERQVPVTAATISTYTRGQRAVVTVAGEVDDNAAAQLRDVLVDTAVRTRPRRLVVDLRGARPVGTSTVRALVDGYRAGGHSGTTLAAINIPADLFDLLIRLGVTRLFFCRPATARPDSAVSAEAADPCPPAVARAEANHDVAGPLCGPLPLTASFPRLPDQLLGRPLSQRTEIRWMPTGKGRTACVPRASPTPAGRAGRQRWSSSAGRPWLRRPFRPSGICARQAGRAAGESGPTHCTGFPGLALPFEPALAHAP